MYFHMNRQESALRKLCFLALILFSITTGALVHAGDEAKDGFDFGKLEKASFEDPNHQTSFASALKLLKKNQLSGAKKLFVSLKKTLKIKTEKESIELALDEIKTSSEFQKLSKLLGKGKTRSALKKCEKAVKKYSHTESVKRIESLIEQCKALLYYVIADFELPKKKKKNEEDSDEDSDEEKPAEEEPSGDKAEEKKPIDLKDVGANTSFAKKPKSKGPENKKKSSKVIPVVREGDRSLKWRTSADLSSIKFDRAKGQLSDYRYLNFSIRVENRKEAPALRLLFDCDERGFGGGGAGGGRGGRGGRRNGTARVVNRSGFHKVIKTSDRWVDHRIDLKKFDKVGAVQWDDVVTFRVVHTVGVAGRVIIDNIRLEKE